MELLLLLNEYIYLFIQSTQLHPLHYLFFAKNSQLFLIYFVLVQLLKFSIFSFLSNKFIFLNLKKISFLSFRDEFKSAVNYWNFIGMLVSLLFELLIFKLLKLHFIVLFFLKINSYFICFWFKGFSFFFIIVVGEFNFWFWKIS